MSFAVIFVTIERPHAAQRFVTSVRNYFPDIPIYVADQSRQIGGMGSFYAAHGVRVIRMDYDVGLAAARNRLVEEVTEERFVLCDDDFVFGPQAQFGEAMRILDAHPEIGVVGGVFREKDEWSEYYNRLEAFLEYDPKNRILTEIPIYHAAPVVRQLGDIQFYLCDMVHNFAVFRKSIFSEIVRWDDTIRIFGEHDDFYLNLKLNSDHRVAYLPTMVVLHRPIGAYTFYYRHLRSRTEGLERFLAKWNLDQVLYWNAVWSKEHPDVPITWVNTEAARRQFFVNADLSLHRAQAQPGDLELHDSTRIAAVGALDPQGERSANSALARLMIRNDDGHITVATDPLEDAEPGKQSHGGKATMPTIERSSGERISGEALAMPGSAAECSRWRVFFRYDPIFSETADFNLWYRQELRDVRESGSERGLAVRLRWFSNDGRVLVWEGEREILKLNVTGYWQPLLIRVPLQPPDCAYFRFEVIAECGPDRVPLCTGFLVGDRIGRPKARLARDLPSYDVLALSRVQDHAAELPDASLPPEAGDRGSPEDGIELPSIRVEAPTCRLLLLQIDALAALEAIVVVGWPGLGRMLFAMRLPGAGWDAPALAALPDVAAVGAGARIFGYRRGDGLVPVRLRPLANPAGRDIGHETGEGSL